jgi:hypothetical protein
MATNKSKLISDKIDMLVSSGEVPNTSKGRKQAAGMAYGMADAGRLKPGGVYVPVTKPKKTKHVTKMPKRGRKC